MTGLSIKKQNALKGMKVQVVYPVTDVIKVMVYAASQLGSARAQNNPWTFETRALRNSSSTVAPPSSRTASEHLLWWARLESFHSVLLPSDCGDCTDKLEQHQLLMSNLFSSFIISVKSHNWETNIPAIGCWSYLWERICRTTLPNTTSAQISQIQFKNTLYVLTGLSEMMLYTATIQKKVKEVQTPWVE